MNRTITIPVTLNSDNSGWPVKVGLLLLLIAGSFWLALAAGSLWLNPLTSHDEMAQTILWQLRLPRILTAFAVGGLLALSGCWLQVALGNPLAEPYLLGISGSASTGALIAPLLLPLSGVALTVGATLGALCSMLLILPLSRFGPLKTVLAGVVLSAFWGACVTLLLALVPQEALGAAIGWMMGNLASGFLPFWLLLALLLPVLAVGLLLARSCDRLLLGDLQAASLGVNCQRLRLWLLLLASGCTALTVAAAGTIGFVGLIVPHITRLLFGANHRLLLPLSLLLGGLFLMLADTLARTVIAPAELPVGVLTAALGVPLFLWLLLRRV